jgi:hypothetical protein
MNNELGYQMFSFRDPDARVLKEDNRFVRYISIDYKDEFEHFLASGLYNELISDGLIIQHIEIELEISNKNWYKKILPEQIEFISYPFEWSYLQWRTFVMNYIRINLKALKFGMVLKDANPYNFYFEAGNIKLLDTTSFIFYNDRKRWIAYNDFISKIFGPFALMYYNGNIWANLLQAQLKGLPIGFISKQLPMKSWFNLNCFVHIHCLAFFGKKQIKTRENNPEKGLSIQKMELLFSSLYSTIKTWNASKEIISNWSNYYETGVESEEYKVSKAQIIDQWLSKLNVETILDLGANTGFFSFLSSNHSRRVLALEPDSYCVDEMCKQIERKNVSNVIPIVGSLTQPSPPLGILNNEVVSFYNRAKSDVVLSLALVHHLFIIENIPLLHIANMLVELTTNYLIIEFVPKKDSKVQIMINNKEGQYLSYDLIQFKRCFSSYFELLNEIRIEDSLRHLLLYKKK